MFDSYVRVNINLSYNVFPNRWILEYSFEKSDIMFTGNKDTNGYKVVGVLVYVLNWIQ